MHVPDHHPQRRLSLERFAACEHLERRDRERVNVGRSIGAPAAPLLGGGIGGASPLGRPVQVERDRGDAEVSQVDVAGFIQQQVAGFDITVDDAALVSRLQGAGDVVDPPQGRVDIDRRPLLCGRPRFRR